MSRNRHDRVVSHFGEDLDTNMVLDGAIGDIPDGTVLHDALLLLLSGGESETVPPINYADPNLGTLVYYFNTEVPEIVQWAQGSGGIVDFGATATLAASPEPGNKMILVYAYRGTSTAHNEPSGYIKHSDVQGDDFDGGRLILYSKTAAIGESSSHFMSSNAHRKNVYLAEWAGVGDFIEDTEVDDTNASTSRTTNSLSPSAQAVLFAGFNQSARNPSIAIQSPATEDWDVDVDVSGPSVVFGHQVVDAGTHTITAVSNLSESWGHFLASFENTLDSWVLGPSIQDGSNTTYHAAAGDECMRVELSTPIFAYEAVVHMAFATGVERTYGFYGTNEPDYSNLTLLDETTFTPLGSSAAEDISFIWPVSAAYQYYVLIGPSEERQLHELTLHGLTGVATTSHPLTINRSLPEQHPATSISFDDSVAGIGETDVQHALETLTADTEGSVGLSAIINNVSPGVKFDLEMPFSGRITAARLLADQTGSLVVDLWKDSYPNYSPTVADSICASAKPTLSSALKSQDTTLTGWTTNFNVGDVIRINVDSSSTLTRATLALRFERSASSPAIGSIQLGRIDRTATIREPVLVYNQSIAAGLITQTATAHTPTVT